MSSDQGWWLSSEPVYWGGLPTKESFSVQCREWSATVRAAIFKSDDQKDAALFVALALSTILVLGSIGFAVAVTPQDEQFSEFYILTGDDGEFVADDYPDEFTQGESQSLVAGIENHEQETVNYTVVVQLERVEGEGRGTEVIEREELNRFETTLGHNETRHIEHDITPTIVGEELRLTYLLYDGKVPEEPTQENAYQNLHLWITVEETDAQDPIMIPTGGTNPQESG